MTTEVAPQLRRLLALTFSPESVMGMPHDASERLRPSAVLVPLVVREQTLSILFTRRSAHLRHHAGQISFPGGRIEPGDADSREAALREAEEEIGLSPSRVQVLGRMDAYRTGTGYLIHPWVGLIERPAQFIANPAEVEEIFEVPLDYLLDPRNHREEVIVGGGRSRAVHAMPYGRHHIWGATAGIVMQLYRLLEEHR